MFRLNENNSRNMKTAAEICRIFVVAKENKKNVYILHGELCEGFNDTIPLFAARKVPHMKNSLNALMCFNAA